MGELSLIPNTCDTLRKWNRSQNYWRAKLFISLVTLSSFLSIDPQLLLFVKALKNRHGSFTVISAKPCQNALGQSGICMFMWDCIKSEGVHLGTCSDRFLFGSCCHHNSTSMDVQQSKQNVSDRPQYTESIQAIQITPLADLMKIPQKTTTNITATTGPSMQHPTGPFLHSNSPTSHHTYSIDSGESTANGGASLANTVINNSNIEANFSEPLQNSLSSTYQEGTIASTSRPQTLDESLTSPTAISHTNSLANISTPAQQLVNAPIATSPHSDTNSVILTFPNPVIEQNSSVTANEFPISTTNQANVSQNDRFHSTKKPVTNINPIYMNPLAQTQSQTLQSQQNKPQAISWLSKPSLIANAIFHSFKPYLSPNRHRPTYKPYIHAGYRPQHYRPVVQQQSQRPSFLFTGQQAQQHKPQVSSIGSAEEEQRPNNDHHIVNLTTSSMTDRHRPIDKNHYGSDGNLQQSNKNNHHELIPNLSLPTFGLNNANYSSQGSFASSSLASDAIQQASNSTSTHNFTAQFESQQNTDTSNHEHHHAMSNFGIISNEVLFSNNSNHYQNHNETKQGDINQTRPFPSYPLISNFSNNNIVSSPTTNPLDEIYGLSTSTTDYNKISGSQNHSISGNLISLQSSQAINSPQHDYHSIASQQTDSVQSMQNNVDLFSGTTTLPPGTILIGNIDEPPIFSSTAAVINNNSHSTHAPSAVITSAIPQTDIILEPSTASPLPVTTATPTSEAIKKGTGESVSSTGDSNGKETVCGVTSMYPQTKVVGGKNAAFGAWPWQVSVRKVSFFGFTSTHRCGGAVISNEWIATAGHCVEDLALQSIRIRVGEYDFSSMSEPYPHVERAARRKVVHPKYNFYTYENDLALVQLDQPLQFPPHVAPICLPPDNIELLGRNATVTGWGRLNEGGTLPTILQEVRVPIVSNDKCKDMFLNAGRPEYIPDIFLCAGYEEGGRDSCQGDSGGPLQVRGDDGKWFLAGIISWGIGCAEQNLPGVCTRISRFKLWIQSTINSGG